MSQSASRSDSASTTSSVNEDNRVAADNGSLVLAKDAIYSVKNEFGDNNLKAFESLVGLVRDAGQVVVKTADDANANTSAQIAAFTSAIQNDKQGTSTTEQSIVQYIPLLIGAAVVIFVLMTFFKGKKA